MDINKKPSINRGRDRLVETCKDLRDRLVETCKDLVDIPSPTGHEQVIGDYIETFLSKAGFQVKRDTCGNVLGCIQGKNPGRSILLFTHSDTASSINEKIEKCQVLKGEEFSKDGYVLKGRGTIAPKGSLAVILEVASLMASLRTSFKGKLYVAVVTKDLGGNHDGMKELFGANPISPDLAIVGEPTNNQLGLGARGLSLFEVELIGKVSHSGSPNNLENPVYALADYIRRIQSFLPTNFFNYTSSSQTIVNIKTVRNAPNTPERCSLLLDRRFLPTEDLVLINKYLEDELQKTIRKYRKIDYKIEQKKIMFPFYTPETNCLISELENCVEQRQDFPLRKSFLSCSSNGGYTEKIMLIPTVAFGPGSLGNLGPDEHIKVNELVIGANVLFSITAGFLG